MDYPLINIWACELLIIIDYGSFFKVGCASYKNSLQTIISENY